ncbi:MAG: FecR domain-containing protein [Akkermansiaceae bacterium]|nr:FecR domain-containing protein [Akkermansiaceae bacterium]
MNNAVFESNLSRALDRDLSPGEFADLERHLIASREARLRYMEYVDLHTVLDLELQNAAPQQPGKSKVIDVTHIDRRQKRRALRIGLLSAAAILIIGLISMHLFSVREKEPALTFQTSPGAQFALTHDGSSEAPEGLVLEKNSRLQLSHGTAELTFASGVKSIIMAPADMTLYDDDTLFLSRGTAWFQVPKGAEGFTVKTQDLNIVDLGTEFGVVAEPAAHDEVHVLKGKVAVTATRPHSEPATLEAGESRRIDPQGRLATIPSRETPFVTFLPKPPPFLHWSFDGDDPFQPDGSLPAVKTIRAQPVQSDSRPAAQRIVPGKNGQGLLFDGKGDHMKTNWRGILGREPRSVACWIKIHPTDQHGWAPIVEWGKMSGNGYWRFRVSKDESHPKRAVLRLGLGQTWFDGQSNLADGKWHHVAVVDPGNINQAGDPDIRFYVDGEEEPAMRAKNSKAVHQRETKEGLPMILGVHHIPLQAPYHACFNGMIDELFVFRATLTPGYVKKIMRTHQP